MESQNGFDVRSTPAAGPRAVVFIIDDDVSVRESLELLIRSAGWRPETLPSVLEFLTHTRQGAPGCLILDMRASGSGGPALRQHSASGARGSPLHGVSIDHANGSGGALKRSRPAIDTETLCARYATLSKREREVMALVVSGLRNKQVARELGISEITVKAHRGSLMRKMRATSLPDLVTMSARLADPGTGAVQTFVARWLPHATAMGAASLDWLAASGRGPDPGNDNGLRRSPTP